MKKKRKRLTQLFIALILYILLVLIPILVILNVWNLSAMMLAWILFFIIIFVGAERLYVSFKSNSFWRIENA